MHYAYGGQLPAPAKLWHVSGGPGVLSMQLGEEKERENELLCPGLEAVVRTMNVGEVARVDLEVRQKSQHDAVSGDNDVPIHQPPKQ